MGASPSKKLVNAAASGDVVGLQAALDAGADVNAPVGQRRGTALHAAARVGYVRATHALLAAGARDVRDARGRTALHLAAKHAQGAIVGILLDRGADHFAVDHAGLRAIDWAARGRDAGVLRLMETRVCPFFGPLLLEVRDWLGRPRLTEVWVAVHRARPWDNPAIARTSVSLCVYESRAARLPQAVLDRPALRPLAADTEGDVVFELVSAAGRGKRAGARPRPTTLRARAPRVLFQWLADVLGASFAGGRGPGFDDNGDVAAPAPARAMAALFSTAELTKAPALTLAAMALPRAADPAEAVGGDAACGWQRSPPSVLATLGAAARATAARAAAVANEGLSDPTAVGAGGGTGLVGPPLALPQQPQPAAAATAAAGQPAGTGYATYAAAARPPAQSAAPAAVAPHNLPPSAPPATPTVAVGGPASRRATSTSAAVVGAGRSLQMLSSADAAARNRRLTTVPSSRAGAPGRAGATAALAPGAPLPDDVEFDVDPPEDFLCPVTLQLMTDPVVCVGDGHTYSRAGIATWLAEHRTSPKTNAVMTDGRLVATHLLRGQVLAWVERHRIDHLPPGERAERRAAGAAQMAAASAAERQRDGGGEPIATATGSPAPRLPTPGRAARLLGAGGGAPPTVTTTDATGRLWAPAPAVTAAAPAATPVPVTATAAALQPSLSRGPADYADYVVPSAAADVEAEAEVDPQPERSAPAVAAADAAAEAEAVAALLQLEATLALDAVRPPRAVTPAGAPPALPATTTSAPPASPPAVDASAVAVDVDVGGSAGLTAAASAAPTAASAAGAAADGDGAAPLESSAAAAAAAVALPAADLDVDVASPPPPRVSSGSDAVDAGAAAPAAPAGTAGRSSRAPLPFRPLLFFRSASASSTAVSAGGDPSSSVGTPQHASAGSDDAPPAAAAAAPDAAAAGHAPVDAIDETATTSDWGPAVADDADDTVAAAATTGAATVDAGDGAVVDALGGAAAHAAAHAAADANDADTASVVIDGVEFRFPVPPTHTHGVAAAEALLELHGVPPPPPQLPEDYPVPPTGEPGAAVPRVVEAPLGAA